MPVVVAVGALVAEHVHPGFSSKLIEYPITSVGVERNRVLLAELEHLSPQP